jgi:O-acetyl-ADP-ribose deacetylase (regulator of RNase III)
VIHTVGPVYRDGKHGEPALLANCYRRSLTLARENSIRTIAFAGISTGVYGYPKQAAARIAVGVMREHENDFDEIIACCFGAEDKKIYVDLLA